jgi:hypothetical protein
MILLTGNDTTKAHARLLHSETLSCACYSWPLSGVLASKRLMQRYDPSTVTGSVMIVGTIFLSIVVLPSTACRQFV